MNFRFISILQAVDVGESMYIHAFGAYFGLAVSRVLHNEKYSEARSEGSVYHSDIFSMIGNIVLPQLHSMLKRLYLYRCIELWLNIII